MTTTIRRIRSGRWPFRRTSWRWDCHACGASGWSPIRPKATTQRHADFHALYDCPATIVSTR